MAEPDSGRRSLTSPKSTSSRGSPSPTSRSSLGATLANQHEHLTKLDGDFKSLRAQFTEFWKNNASIQEVKALRKEMEGIRAAAAGVRANAQQGQQLQQLQQEVQQLQQELAAARSTAQQVQRLQQALDALQRQVGTQGDVMQSHRGLHEAHKGLHEEVARTKGQFEPLAQQVQDHARELQSLKRDVQTVGSGHQQGQEAKREVDKLRQEHGTMKQEHGTMKQEHGAMKQEQSSLKNKIQGVEQQAGEAKRQVDQLKQEVTSVKSEAQGAKGCQREQQQHMRMLEEKTRGLDDIGVLKATVANNNSEFWGLKKQLYNSGVLAPPAPPPEPEKQPVGTLELGEDIYTTRLLIRIGFLKGKLDAAREAKEKEAAESDGMSESSSDIGQHDSICFPGIMDNMDEQVTGIQVPEVHENDALGHFLINWGWLFICNFTFVTQALIVAIMVMYGMEAGDSCSTEPLSDTKWWTLHVSKSLAMMVAGCLMGKHLMDIVNYWMVSELLLNHTDLEVTVCALLRICMQVFIAFANVVLFLTQTSPANVWINMTALGFIGELSEESLNVARRGVFGHRIGKAVTGVNFALNFMSEYPWWFTYARAVALGIASVFICVFAVILWKAPDNVCNKDGTSPFAFLPTF